MGEGFPQRSGKGPGSHLQEDLLPGQCGNLFGNGSNLLPGPANQLPAVFAKAKQVA